MNIQIKTTKCNLGQDVIALAREKTEELAKFIGHGAENVQAFVELEKTAPQQTGKIWRAEMNIDWEGERIRVESIAENIEKAIHKAHSHMSQELKKRKTRGETLFKKGGSAIKSFLRGFGDR
jgi:ribosomal subunit interface protein